MLNIKPIKLYRKQKYSSCSLIAAINAKIYLGGDDVDDSVFESLVDLTKCRYGGAIFVEKSYPILGVSFKDGPLETLELEWVRENLPVQIGHCDPKFGFHSALVVATKGKYVTLVNSSYTNTLWENIEFYPHTYNRILRSFKLLGVLNDW